MNNSKWLLMAGCLFSFQSSTIKAKIDNIDTFIKIINSHKLLNLRHNVRQQWELQVSKLKLKSMQKDSPLASTDSIHFLTKLKPASFRNAVDTESFNIINISLQYSMYT